MASKQRHKTNEMTWRWVETTTATAKIANTSITPTARWPPLQYANNCFWNSDYSLRQKKLGHFNQTLFFPFSCSPCPSQSCLSRFGHQILYTNIEGTRRPQSVPTILTETVGTSVTLPPTPTNNIPCWISTTISRMLPSFASANTALSWSLAEKR